MANVLLTTGCNLKCSYCFADEKMGRGQRRHMAMNDVHRLLEFFRRSNYSLFRVMGGEPTLHPQFTDIVDLALAAGMRVDVLSNATWNEACATYFEQVSPRRIYFLLNLDHPDRYRPGMWQHIEANLARLPEARNITVSFNIFEREPRYSYILDVARRYSIEMIRLSFSLPVLGAQNRYLNFDEYKAMAPFVMRFFEEAGAIGVRVQMDNAVPLCIFSDADMGRLLLNGVLDLQRNSRCEPVIDIGPDLSVWCCFCLSSVHNRRLEDFGTLKEVKDYYSGVLYRYQTRLTPLDECDGCRYRECWGCQGGCITHSLLRHRDVYPDGILPEDEFLTVEDGAVLGLAEGAQVKRYARPHDCFILTHRQGGVEVEVDGTVFAAVEPLLNGRLTLGQIREVCLSQGPSADASPLDAFVHQERVRGIEDLLVGLVRQGFLSTTGTNG
jgi:sulfatase maturation enzyme AslB (radical SAM superfamily)